ncbi:unnamed protein product [Gordionus sp. m RMFG-2023]
MSPTPTARYRVLYLGTSLPTLSKEGLKGIQEPLKDLLLTPNPTIKGVDCWCSVWSNGILIEYVESPLKGTPSKTFHPIQTLHFCAAVRFNETFEQTITSRNDEEDGNSKGENSHQNEVINVGHNISEYPFLPLDSPVFNDRPFRFDRPPVFACVVRRTQGVKVLECHAFLCKSLDSTLDLCVKAREAYLENRKLFSLNSNIANNYNAINNTNSTTNGAFGPPLPPPREIAQQGAVQNCQNNNTHYNVHNIVKTPLTALIHSDGGDEEKSAAATRIEKALEMEIRNERIKNGVDHYYQKSSIDPNMAAQLKTNFYKARDECHSFYESSPISFNDNTNSSSLLSSLSPHRMFFEENGYNSSEGGSQYSMRVSPYSPLSNSWQHNVYGPISTLTPSPPFFSNLYHHPNNYFCVNPSSHTSPNQLDSPVYFGFASLRKSGLPNNNNQTLSPAYKFGTVTPQNAHRMIEKRPTFLNNKQLGLGGGLHNPYKFKSWGEALNNVGLYSTDPNYDGVNYEKPGSVEGGSTNGKSKKHGIVNLMFKMNRKKAAVKANKTSDVTSASFLIPSPKNNFITSNEDFYASSQRFVLAHKTPDKILTSPHSQIYDVSLGTNLHYSPIPNLTIPPNTVGIYKKQMRLNEKSFAYSIREGISSHYDMHGSLPRLANESYKFVCSEEANGTRDFNDGDVSSNDHSINKDMRVPPPEPRVDYEVGRQNGDEAKHRHIIRLPPKAPPLPSANLYQVNNIKNTPTDFKNDNGYLNHDDDFSESTNFGACKDSKSIFNNGTFVNGKGLPSGYTKNEGLKHNGFNGYVGKRSVEKMDKRRSEHFNLFSYG